MKSIIELEEGCGEDYSYSPSAPDRKAICKKDGEYCDECLTKIETLTGVLVLIKEHKEYMRAYFSMAGLTIESWYEYLDEYNKIIKGIEGKNNG